MGTAPVHIQYITGGGWYPPILVHPDILGYLKMVGCIHPSDALMHPSDASMHPMDASMHHQLSDALARQVPGPLDPGSELPGPVTRGSG